MSTISERPRVLVVTTNFPLRRRGDRTGNFVVDPVVALADDVDTTVLCPIDSRLAAPRERWEGKVDVVRYRYWWPRRAQRLAHGDGIPTALRTDRRAWLQLVPFLVATVLVVLRHARRADVVHAHWLPVALLCLPARWLHRTPIAVTLHGTDVTQFPDRFVAWGLRRMDVVVSAHDDLLATAGRLAPRSRRERIRHLVEPQPVDAAEDAEVAARLEGGPVVLFVARTSPERDPLTFVRAATHVREVVDGVTFALVGSGPLDDAIRVEIAALALEDTVEVFGHRPDVWTFLGRADVFCALSDRNNVWVTALVEAMRAGVPVVATTAGDTARVLRDRHDAMLVPVGDDRAVAEAIVAVLTDATLAEGLGATATNTLAENGFDPAAVRSRTLDLYRELAGAPAG